MHHNCSESQFHSSLKLLVVDCKLHLLDRSMGIKFLQRTSTRVKQVRLGYYRTVQLLPAGELLLSQSGGSNCILKAQNETILMEFVERRLCLGGLQMCKKEDLLLLPNALHTAGHCQQ